MPTRTINLKMVLGRKEERAEIRRALWTTHLLVNQAVAAIERTLLLCRGSSYWTRNEDEEEVQVPESQVVGDALKMARDAQRSNGKENLGTDEEVLNALRSLYEQLVPSCVLDDNGAPQEGNAQASNAWVSPLMDPESQGGLSVYDKVLDPPPNWIKKKEESQSEWEEESIQWLESEDSLRLQRATGSPPGWVRRLRNGQPWQDHFIKDQQKKRKELEQGSAPVVKSLKELGLLPLIKPLFREMLDREGNGVSVWDRLAVRLAVAHLLSWESWNHKTKKEHEKAHTDCENFRRKCREMGSHFKILREYERVRHGELKKVAFFDDERPFRIGARTIRSWDRVREEWLKSGNTAEQRLEICKRLQTKLRGKFGDPDLFRWLAQGGREHLWKDRDSVTPVVQLNIAERLADKRKKYAVMTFADARVHPRWVMYEAPGGTNLRNYSINAAEKGLYVRIPLLMRDADAALKEADFPIPLAASAQLSSLSIEDGGKGNEKLLKFRSTHQDHEASLGGAEILFDRTYLEHDERNDESFFQRPGPVWFKLTLDVQSKAPTDWLDGRGRVATPPAVHHFNTALSKPSKYKDKLKPGLRVLSVDLGMRTFAACAVFELVQGRPEHGLCFPAADGRDNNDPEKLWAKHERSFKLTLPGETPTERERKARTEAWDEIRSLRRDINRLKEILRLGVLEDEQRRTERIEDFLDSIDERSTGDALGKDAFEGLEDPKFRTTPELWQHHCQVIYDRAERILAKRFSQWRRRTRPKSASWKDWSDRRAYAGGKSIWMLECLEAVRKLILSWNLRGRTYGAVNRQDRKQFGTVASHLLRHINRLKEDRIKTGADLIIQAARGCVPVENGAGWVRKHEPCRLILFEDLARYRFRIDRPRRENSQLMKWNHREIIAEATMQAELYGMVVKTTSAGFTSRYLASSGAPGVRCRCLTEDDLENGLPKPYVVSELEWMLGNTKNKDFDELQSALKDRVRPGMLVPWSGGELFATLNADREEKKVHIIHADLNAAINLQRRFWGRCGEAFRISCRKTSEEGMGVYELAEAPKARLLGALQQLEHGAAPFHLVPVGIGKFQGERYEMKPAGGKKIKLKLGGEETETEDDEIADAIADWEAVSGRGETFFRDPSGILFPSRHWIPSKQYWSIVKQRVRKAMAGQDAPRDGEDYDDDADI